VAALEDKYPLLLTETLFLYKKRMAVLKGGKLKDPQSMTTEEKLQASQASSKSVDGGGGHHMNLVFVEYINFRYVDYINKYANLSFC